MALLLMGPGWGDGTLRSTQTCTKPSIPRSGGEVAYLAFFQRAFGWPAQAFSREALPGLPHPLAGFWRRVGSCHRGHHAHALPLTRRPLALDFHPAFATRGPLAKTATPPILWSFTQSPLDRIAPSKLKPGLSRRPPGRRALRWLVGVGPPTSPP